MKVSIDFETYSEAGYRWNAERNKWDNNGGTGKVGAAVYSEHPSTEVLCLYYRLPDGSMNSWIPGVPAPTALFDHIRSGGIVYARNSLFEYFIWKNVCHERMGWPELPINQLMDDQALSLAWGMPAGLEKCGKAMGMPLKMEDGKRLIRKFSIPRNPTKKDTRKRILPSEDPADAFNLYHYCAMDVVAEEAINEATPPLTPFEREVFLLDQKINTDGCQIDVKAVDDCIAIVDQAMEKYTAECEALTVTRNKLLNPEEVTVYAVRKYQYNPEVKHFCPTPEVVKIHEDKFLMAAKEIGRYTLGRGIKPSETAKLKVWLESKGINLSDTQKATLEGLLKGGQPLLPDVKRVIEIRLSIGAASVKKLYAIKQRVSRDGRLRGMFQYCGASNTGRFAGRGPQPQNLPNSGPTKDWGIEEVEKTYKIASTRSLEAMEAHFGDAVAAIAGSLRGLFMAAPGHDLICSDYSAIEARVLAFMAGEKWREDVFRTHGKIYETSASLITGIPLEEILKYPEINGGDKHPARKLGKVGELSSGYGGWIGAWKAFGADKFMDDFEIKNNILKWRNASPKIVGYWDKCEKDAIEAIKFPGHKFGMYQVLDKVLYCTLPSGRRLQYHSPRLGQNKWGKPSIMFKGTDSITKQWVWQDTYGGKLTENIIQAVSRDILVWAMVNLDRAGYRIVMHVHDEIIVEVPEGQGSIEEVEKIMGAMPPWCADWPIVAAGGWRGKRYRKD